MNTEARNRFDELVKTDPNALTGADIEFLKARSSYLTEEQKAVLDKLPKQLEEANEARNQEDAEAVNTSASAAEVTGAEVEGADNSSSKTENYDSMKKSDLQDLLRSRKIDFDENAKKEDLISLLNK